MRGIENKLFHGCCMHLLQKQFDCRLLADSFGPFAFYPQNRPLWLKRTSTFRVVRKGSWKERVVGKFQVRKFRFKLERASLSWKEPSKVGKNRAKLEKPTEVEKFLLKLESFAEVGLEVQFKFSNLISHFPTSALTFRLRHELSNFNLSNFILDVPTSRSFQLPFSTTRIPTLDLTSGYDSQPMTQCKFIYVINKQVMIGSNVDQKW